MKIPHLIVPQKPRFVLNAFLRSIIRIVLALMLFMPLVIIYSAFSSARVNADYLLGSVCVIAIVIYILRLPDRNKRKYDQYLADMAMRKRQASIISEFNSWNAKADSEGFHHIPEVAFRLDEDELAYYVSDNVEYYSYRTVGQESTTLGGMVHTKYNISLGLAKSNSRDVMAYRHLDDGSVCITNKRIFFVGNHLNLSIPLSTIVKNYNNFEDIEISSDAISGNIMFCGMRNALIATVILESLAAWQGQAHL